VRQTKKNAALGASAAREQDWRSIPAATATSGWRAKLGKRAVPLTYAWPSCSRALRNPVSFKSRTSLLESAFWSCAEAQKRRSAEAEEGGNRKKSKVAPWSLDRSQPRCQHTDGRRPHASQRILVRRQVNERLHGARLRGKELLRQQQLARGGPAAELSAKQLQGLWPRGTTLWHQLRRTRPQLTLSSSIDAMVATRRNRDAGLHTRPLAPAQVAQGRGLAWTLSQANTGFLFGTAWRAAQAGGCAR